MLWWQKLQPLEACFQDQINAFCKTLRSEQNVPHFADDIYNCISLKKKKNFVAKVNNKSPLFPIMAWHQIDDKALPDPILTQIHHVIWRD